MTEVLNLLMIERSPSDSRLIQALLSENTSVVINFQRTRALMPGLDLLARQQFDVVLLAQGLADSSDREALLAVRRSHPDTAVIVLTGHEDENLGLEATQAGAQDSLAKESLSSQLLVRSIRYSIERKRFEKRLEHLATHDDLTGLPNRQLFNFTLGLALERARRTQYDNPQGGRVAVMLLDLDNFKQVNDTYGHVRGDELLEAVGRRLQGCMRKSDTVARMGGDEFTLVVEQVSGPLDCEAIAQKVLDTLAGPYNLGGDCLATSASLGISIFPGDGSDPESLLKNADIAMYRAKQNHNCFRFFSAPEAR